MKDLVKNPIGIIALFISLIYAFANLLLGATAGTLDHSERFPLIVFIVLFPVVVLGVFYLLVTNHHGKLYAPGDYKDDKSFLRTLTQEERELKLEKEAQEVQDAQKEAREEIQVSGNGQANVKHGEAETPVQDKPQSVQRTSDIRSEIQLVESLAISKFESEFKQRAERDVGIGGTGVSFDALFETTGKLTFIEVKMVRHPASFSMMLDRLLYNAVVADRYMNSNFNLILALVHEFDSAELARIENVWRRRTEACPAKVELRLIPRSDLGG